MSLEATGLRSQEQESRFFSCSKPVCILKFVREFCEQEFDGGFSHKTIVD
jgi:hypothetical protein